MALWMGGCAVARFDVPGAVDEAAYAAAHPYYAEYCALTQIKKKQGFGADIRGEIGGHAVFYLNGACLVPLVGYPVLQVCAPTDGVGLSMNAHFYNAKWVATPGRALFFDGGLPPGAGVTRSDYVAVRAAARQAGVYDGVRFHDVVFDDMPAGWSRDEWAYEVSIGTDWGISLARGRYCARVPVTRAQMGRMVAFLNRENAPYREGRRVFDWSVFNDNCIHLAHNALAEAGLWANWPTERFLPIAILDFPVPKNEFVNLMRRTNDAWPHDPGAVYADVPARSELLQDGLLPTYPGALAEAHGVRTPNAVYDTDLKLIFYDDPLTGDYQRHFNQIFTESRYLDAGVNERYLAALAKEAVAARKPLEWWLERPPWRDDPGGFRLVYDRYYEVVGRLAAR